MKIRGLLFLMVVCLSTIVNISCKKSASTDTSSGPTVTDIDGNVYNTIVIGTQTWMVENLKVSHYRNGDPIMSGSGFDRLVTDTIGAIYAYDNSMANQAVYGWLYNWYAIADGRNVAPIGWHVPSDADFTALVANLGGNYLLTRGDTIAGGEMKETGVAHWGNPTYPNIGATNISGWTGLPGGFYDPTQLLYNGLHGFGTWWTTTTMEGTNPLKWAYCMGLSCTTKSALRGVWFKTDAYSIRCLSDKSK